MIHVTINNITAQLYDEPNECPLCHQSIAPIQFNWATFDKVIEEIEYVFRCPNGKCQRLIIGRYKRRPNDVRFIYDQVEFVPSAVLPTPLSKEVRDVSPDFAQIYTQAEHAEQLGLKLLCGPGYRKALEFLIKDYLSFLRPDDAEAIKKLFLGKCISDYVEDARVREVAKRANWLGNDETHYVRTWEGKDLSDLKTLIKLSVHWIQMDILTKNILKDMPEPAR